MADACTRAHAAEARIRHQRDVLAEGQMLQGAGELIRFLHARAHRTAAREHDDVAGLHLAFLDRGDGLLLADEHARRSFLAINAVGIDDARVDGSAFDERTLGRKVAARERDGAGQSAFLRAFGRHDHVIGLDAVLLAENVAEASASFAGLPPVENLIERDARRRQYARVQHAEATQMQHHFRHAAGEKHAHRRMMRRAVRQHIDEAGDAAVDVDPVLDCGPRQSGGVRDGGNVQQQIRRAAERCVNRHRVADGSRRENVAQLEFALIQFDQRARRAHREVGPDWFAGGRERGVWQRKSQRLANDL